MLKSFLRICYGVALALTALAPLAVRAASDQQVAATVLCANPQSDAGIRTAFTPEIPEIARQQGAAGTVYVKIDLTADGTLSSASIIRSSGNQALDQAALRATRESSFAPAVQSCSPVGGSYVYVVDFTQ